MPQVFQQQLVTWEVASGQQRDDVVIPVGETVSEINDVNDLWLAPGGHRMLLQAHVTRWVGSRVAYAVLASVDLTGSSPVFTEIASGSSQYAVSGDGGRIAALVPAQGHSVGRGPRTPMVWDVATGQRIAEGPILSEEQATEEITLDLRGERAFLTPFSVGSKKVSIWRIGEPALQSVPLHVAGWQVVVPLGSDDDTSLMLVDGNVVGLMLASPGRPAPMERMTAPLPDPYAPDNRNQFGLWFDEMNAMLASCVPVEEERPHNLPAGTYSGPLCG